MAGPNWEAPLRLSEVSRDYLSSKDAFPIAWFKFTVWKVQGRLKEKFLGPLGWYSKLIDLSTIRLVFILAKEYSTMK